jgi:hypothetical protein
MKNLIWLFAATVLITSCKKESDNNPSPAPSLSACAVTEIRDSVGNKLESSYEYDANRRITKMYYTDFFNGTIVYNTFAYSGNSLTITGYKMDNSPDGRIGNATLNTSGFVSRVTETKLDTSNGIPRISKDTSEYTYNSNGQLLTENFRNWIRDANGNFIFRYFRTNSYEYTNGRVSKEFETTSELVKDGYQNSRKDTTMYTYDDSSPVVTNNPVVLKETLLGLLGKLMANRIPVKSESSNTKAFYTATIDSKGNPTKIRTKYVNGNGIIDSYTKVYSNYCP